MIATKPRMSLLEPMRTHHMEPCVRILTLAARLIGRTDTYAKGGVPATRIHHGDHGYSSSGPGDNRFHEFFQHELLTADSTAVPSPLVSYSSNADLLESIVGSVPHSWYAKDM
ncbi:hypothetical protein PIB30_018525 [Stylosanthes scabra]|uniref:Uncharacterized protein n=1 Tax=Stylosanthes scabra TaxID=79078 RepID=A0ABU6Y9W8_9FABA|nr:hypothetical protein [Stylosanthes scabra]